MRILIGLILLAFTLPSARAAPPGLLCRAAIEAAERVQAIPAHLMAAIGRVESGRRDDVTGAWHPWPWTVNAEGEGHFYDTKPQAIAAVRTLMARGVKSIDVGCMQVNLMHHPDAFATLDQAFDPAMNAAYAARFLRELYGQSGAWPKAVAAYHSATPELAAPYAKKVLAVWPEESRHPGAGALATAWGATLPHGARIPFQRNLPAGADASAIPLAGPPNAPGRGLDLYRSRPIARAAGKPKRIGRF